MLALKVDSYPWVKESCMASMPIATRSLELSQTLTQIFTESMTEDKKRNFIPSS